jgi:hypothetical protein
MRPSAPDPASLLRRDPALTHIPWLWITPTSVVGSSADMCPMDLSGPWAIEIEEILAATICNEAHVFLRHAHVLPRRLQVMWADDVIKTYKSCRQALQHDATVH